LAIELVYGELSTYVQDPDLQFKVLTKDHNIIDLGTAFGVKLDQNRLTMHVFSGKVAIAPKEIDLTRMDIISTKNAVDISLKTLEMRHLNSSAAELFDTWQAQLITIPLPSTGTNLQPGEQDTAWQVQRVGETSIRHPIVFNSGVTDRFPNDVKTSQFVSLDVHEKGNKFAHSSVDNETMDIYSCSFELHDVDLNTASINVHYIADDCLEKVLLNGKEIPINGSGRVNYSRFSSFVIDQHFLEGTNKLEFFIGNENAGKLHNPDIKSERSPMSFRVLLNGKVRPLMPENPGKTAKHR
jgi:hypothetical protein